MTEIQEKMISDQNILSNINSGSSWVSKFPQSKSVEDLEPSFRNNVKRFIKAMTDARVSVTVNSTVRPPQRAYLMHYSWRIVKKNLDPRTITPMPGVNINWFHGSLEESKRSAQEMVIGYDINSPRLRLAPATNSNHIRGEAIDMTISWQQNILIIARPDGTNRVIISTPRDGTNSDLISVGRDYGVIHLINVNDDIFHWSTDGT
jgi:hypothetical protein